MRSSWRPDVRITSTVLLVGVLLLAMRLPVPLLELIELKTYDLRFLSRGPRTPSPAVVLAVIDEKSLDREGRWPWPRSTIAALVDALSRDGARVIGFDIAFAEPDENSQLALLDQLARELETSAAQDRSLAEFIAARRKHADNDRALAAAIANSSATVVLGYFFHFSEAGLGYRLEPEEIERRLERLAPSKYPRVLYRTPEATGVPLIEAYAPEINLEPLTAAAAASGFFSLRSDPDGVLRWMPLIVRAGEHLFPPLALLSAWHYAGRPPLTVTVGPHGVEGIQLGNRFIPTDEAGQLLINYLGPPKTIPHVSVTDVLRGRFTPGTFRDRVVLVGATAIGTHDLRSTPFSPLFPGLEVQATVIDNILTGRFIAKPAWSTVYDVLAVVLISALVAVALPKLGPLQGLAFAATLFALYVLVARWLFVTAGVWLNMVYPLLGLAGTYTTLTAYSYVTEQRQRKRVKETFRQYVAPLVVEEMLKDPGRLRLGGEEKVLTVLFSDLEGFTANAERYTPPEMAAMLSEYYNRVTEQVFRHRGTLKEYVGDELMAIFGAPLDQPDHAARACAAALAMRQARLALAAEWASAGRPRLRARTGINSGPMLVGNLGSRYRFAYGVLGDDVNLGSRLEGLNKIYGTDILVGENTARLVGGAFVLREVDTVRVVGRMQRTRIYELLGGPDTPITLEQEKALRSYAAGLDAYRQRIWGEALALFRQALTFWPEDGPAHALAQRCEAYEKTPPPEDWDGAFDQPFKK